ncbi:hypothetical protein [Cellulomonas composti]|uniref:Uncharacterized protein n=1 Tax=Cellulomonas composti TaxID=266130 RepID=A0A511J6A7_9CELL|nr:hypothetical protein [Cellulomonas composti]GEL93536.1 hypothetical protein CCO02nite_01940 [Cellulomonas composti]
MTTSSRLGPTPDDERPRAIDLSALGDPPTRAHTFDRLCWCRDDAGADYLPPWFDDPDELDRLDDGGFFDGRLLDDRLIDDGAYDDEDDDEDDWFDVAGPDDDLADLTVPGYPLLTDDDVLTTLLGLVGPRDTPMSFWGLLLDDEHRTLPVVLTLPLPAITGSGREHHVRARGIFRQLRSALDAMAPGGSAVVALVRRGGGALAPQEHAWLEVLAPAADDFRVPIRAAAVIGPARARVVRPRAGRSGRSWR